MAKVNTHQLLTQAGYRQHPNYGEIARRAATLGRQGARPNEILSIIATEFGHIEPKKTLLDKPAPFTMYGTPGVDFEYNAVEQMRAAMRLPVSTAGSMMPDAHVGYALPIGGVIELDGAVSPSFVGYDIACRMTLTILDIAPAEFMVHRNQFCQDMQAVSSFGMGAGFESSQRRSHPVMEDPLWKELRHVGQFRDLAWQQLGSSGGGNHFFDAVVGEVTTRANWLPLDVGDEFVAIMTHSGSRGPGHKLATHYVKLAAREVAQVAAGIPKGYEWLSIETDAGREYLQVMGLMGRYAQANHHLIHRLFSKRTGLQAVARYENHHNFAWVQDGAVIHRKGATPAGPGQAGIIPGSSGTPSYLVEGLGNPDSLESSSHGAGRPFSRSEAKRQHDEPFFQEWMTEHDIVHVGVSPDETLLAYKDIDRVMNLQADLVRPIARMRPVVVIMGGAIPPAEIGRK